MTKTSQPANTSYTRNPTLRQPLPNRLVRLLSEARWIALAVLFLYLVIILLTYHKRDRKSVV
jgi:S-DNA-T family DNA segregation ATPase FtsK/SpoIIIE